MMTPEERQQRAKTLAKLTPARLTKDILYVVTGVERAARRHPEYYPPWTYYAARRLRDTIDIPGLGGLIDHIKDDDIPYATVGGRAYKAALELDPVLHLVKAHATDILGRLREAA
jgi:hypothetical protein